MASGRYLVLYGRSRFNVLHQRQVGRIDVVEYLRLGGVLQAFVAADIDLRARLLALVAVEDAQRNADADAEML